MRYIALLRGINVGGKNRVEMKRLKSLLETSGYTNVNTYLNSGNVIFDSGTEEMNPQEVIPPLLEREFGFTIPTLIKTSIEINQIADAIPPEWKNDAEQKTDIAYLFPEIDSEEILERLPMKREYTHLIYVKGAVIWNLKKKDYGKSQLNKIISTRLYKLMTVRNVNTARSLAAY